MDMSNNLIYLSKITSKEIFKLKSESISDLKNIKNIFNKIIIFESICIKSIENNEPELVISSLTAIENISKAYLYQSKKLKTSQDYFLNQLNDHINFIINKAIENNNEKYLDEIALSIKRIGLFTIEYESFNLTGFISSKYSTWIYTLQTLFFSSISKERTSVCFICIDSINEITTKLIKLNKSGPGGIRSFHDNLIELGEIISLKDHYWTASLLQRILHYYLDYFILFSKQMATKDIYYSDTKIRCYFDDIQKCIKNAKNNYSYTNLSKILFSLYGLPSFICRMKKSSLNNFDNIRLKGLYINNFALYLDFNDNVVSTNPDENSIQSYQSYPEILFFIHQYSFFDPYIKNMLIEKLSIQLINKYKSYLLIELNDNKGDDNIIEYFSNYFAILIFLNYKYPKEIEPLLQKLIEIEELFKGKDMSIKKTEIIHYNYLTEMKLIGSWINKIPALSRVNNEFINFLKNFDEIKEENKGIHTFTLLSQYKYPNYINTPNGLWYLNPSCMWGNVFQENIANYYNINNGINYINYHKKLLS